MLHFLKEGERQSGSTPLVILHGLFGSGDNWKSIARELAIDRLVIAPDLPNHGASPHTDRFDYREVARDVAEFLKALSLPPVVLLGHSMGGKVAMSLALQEPELVEALLVVDIAPRAYPPRHQEEFEAMDLVRREGAGSRREAEEIMARLIDLRAVRAFLLKNYVPREDGGYRWRLNLDGLWSHYQQVADWPDHTGTFDSPVLVIRGGRSPYIREEDSDGFERLFPGYRLETIEEAGHWLHAEAKEEFLKITARFLARPSADAG
ncbi:MAG: alpha/beta fold hydrolase [Alkalispirochaetaceae bacterium]